MKFDIYSSFTGYNTANDPTNTLATNLVAGSQNVQVNKRGNVESRKGFTLFGTAGTKTKGIVSSYPWETNSNEDILLRVDSDGVLEAYLNAAWTQVIDSLGTPVCFTTWWDADEDLDLLLFVDGSSNLYSWSGAISTVASATTTTITLADDAAESRFLSEGTVTIDGDDYAYTGISDKELTGVTPDASALTAGAAVMQKVTTNATTPGTTFKNDMIEQRDNQIYIASYSSRNLHVSNGTDYTDYTQPATRAPGDPAVLTLDKNIKAIVPQEDAVYVSAGKGEWYQVVQQQSADLATESLKVTKLKAGSRSAARSQTAWTEVKDAIAYLSEASTLDELSRVEQFNTVKSEPLSVNIQPDFDALDFTDAQIHYEASKIYVTLPKETRVYIYDIEKSVWYPPHTLPISSIQTYQGDLIGFSSVSNEAYKLYDGLDDNGAPISFEAHFGYQNFNQRATLKEFDEFYTEFYSNSATSLVLFLNFDYDGSRGVRSYDLSTLIPRDVFTSAEENTFGTQPFGTQPFASMDDDADALTKVRYINTLSAEAFFEFQPVYKTENMSAQFEIVAFGTNTRISNADAINIKN